MNDSSMYDKPPTKNLKDLNYYLHYYSASYILFAGREDALAGSVTKNIFAKNEINYNAEIRFWQWLTIWISSLLCYFFEFCICSLLGALVTNGYHKQIKLGLFIMSLSPTLVVVRSIFFISNGLIIYGFFFLAIGLFVLGSIAFSE